MRFLKNKKAENLLYGAIMFIILNLVFFAALFIYVARTGTGAGIYEEVYAKKVALNIDMIKKGTNVTIDVSKLYDIADKNEFERLETIKIDNDENLVKIKLKENGGYSYSFFSGNEILWMLDKNAKKLYLEVK